MRDHRRPWHGITNPFSTFCLHIYFQYNFVIISSCFPYFTCPYSYNLVLTATYMCRSYIALNVNRVDGIVKKL